MIHYNFPYKGSFEYDKFIISFLTLLNNGQETEEMILKAKEDAYMKSFYDLYEDHREEEGLQKINLIRKKMKKEQL